MARRWLIAELGNGIESISDESGRIPVDYEVEAVHFDDVVQSSVLESAEENGGRKVRAYGKGVSTGALLEAGIVKAGDTWKLSSKGETTWGRIEGNGQLEVNGHRQYLKGRPPVKPASW